MKKSFILLIIAFIGLITVGFNVEGVQEKPYLWAEQYTHVAHALGDIDGYKYTNSEDAFIENYNDGFRLFEIDLILTSDNQLIGRHDWNDCIYDCTPQDIFKRNIEQVPTLDEIIDNKIYGQYEQLDMKRLAVLMEDYQDAYIITDTKSTNPIEVHHAFKNLVNVFMEYNPDALERIIPQVYNQQMVPIIKSYYPFSDIIFTLYQSNFTDKGVLRFLQKNNIRAVTMDQKRYSKSFVQKLRNEGIYVFVHTINDEKLANYFLNNGLGIYTDFLSPK